VQTPKGLRKRKRAAPGGGGPALITTTGERDEGSLECVIRRHLWLTRTAKPIGSNPDLSRCKTSLVAIKGQGGEILGVAGQGDARALSQCKSKPENRQRR